MLGCIKYKFCCKGWVGRGVDGPEPELEEEPGPVCKCCESKELARGEVKTHEH